MHEHDWASSVEPPISYMLNRESCHRTRSKASPSRTDEHSNSTPKSVACFIYLYVLVTYLFVQPIWCTVSKAHLHTSSSPTLTGRPIPVGRSSLSEASQQVLHRALPPVLVLHLKCFLYDATADCTVKINEPIRFSPELYTVACFLRRKSLRRTKLLWGLENSLRFH
ncbi:hypothetical protein V8E52_011063 [Russula decolorans]